MERHNCNCRPSWRQLPQQGPSPNLRSLRDHTELVKLDCEFMDRVLRRGSISRDVWMTWRGLQSTIRDLSSLISMLHPSDRP